MTRGLREAFANQGQSGRQDKMRLRERRARATRKRTHPAQGRDWTLRSLGHLSASQLRVCCSRCAEWPVLHCFTARLEVERVVSGTWIQGGIQHIHGNAR